MMHAIQPVQSPQPQTPVQPRKSRRSSSRQQIRQRHQQQIRTLTIETSIKLATHLVLCGVTLSALLQIWSQHRASKEKLSQIQSEVQMTQQRVDHQKANFSRNFDPQQAQSIMQEHTNQVPSGQRQVIWLEDIEVDESELSQVPQTQSQP
jgi:hypothetical protein